jgi:hypothetical protein
MTCGPGYFAPTGEPGLTANDQAGSGQLRISSKNRTPTVRVGSEKCSESRSRLVKTIRYCSPSICSVRNANPDSPGALPGREWCATGTRTVASNSVERKRSVLPESAASCRSRSTSLAGLNGSASGSGGGAAGGCRVGRAGVAPRTSSGFASGNRAGRSLPAAPGMTGGTTPGRAGGAMAEAEFIGPALAGRAARSAGVWNAGKLVMSVDEADGEPACRRGSGLPKPGVGVAGAAGC